MMKCIKNLVCICASCALIFSGVLSLSVCANSIENPVTLYAADSYIADGDDYVAVPIRVEDNEEGFFSVVFDIMYNPQIMTYKTCVSKDFIVTEGGEYDNSLSSRGMTLVAEYKKIANYKKQNSDILYLVFSINENLPYTGFTPVQVIEPIVGVGNTGNGLHDDCDVIFTSGECGGLAYCIVGDANDDSVVNLKDVLMLRKVVADFDNLSYSFRASDMDNSLGVDMKDVLMLRSQIATSV